MSRFLHPRYADFSAYTPGEQPKDLAYIKLNTNESPYPPAPAVLEAIHKEEVSDLKLYSDPTCSVLRTAIAKVYHTEKERVFVSNGSDDILNFAFMAFAGHGRRAVFPNITYGFYPVFANLHGIEYEEIPLNTDFSITISDYFHKDALVVIANPNAPTGLLLSKTQVELIVKNNPNNVVLIDEAYIDFGGTTCADLTEVFDNLLVVQTFSKSRSLAGARLGFAIGNKALIEDLEKIKYSTNPYSINRLSLLAGTAAIKATDYFQSCCENIIKTREYTKTELLKRGFTVTDSKANFLFAKKDGTDGEMLYLALRKKGILVRHFAKALLKDYNRITIGTKEQMDKMLLALDEIDKEGISL